MNFELFEKVTENNNGNIIGLNINSKPEYQEDFKNLLRDFNKFTELVCPENLSPIGLDNRWQNSGNYKKYFWNQFKINNTDIKEYTGYSIWLGVDIRGIKIQCGTTQEFSGNRQKENENIFNFIKEQVNEIFNLVGIYDSVIFSKFERNEFLDTSYDRYAALYFQYKGNNEFEDTKYFKVILKFLSEKLTNYLSSRTVASKKDYEEEFKKYWFGDMILQQNGSKYAEGTKTSYFRELTRLKDIINESIFRIDDIELLNIILNRLEKGDLEEYNKRHQNTDPSNGLKQYIIFIKNLDKLEEKYIDKGNLIKSNKNLIKNIILYGAPGVGKTHNYKKLISLIEEGKSQKEIFDSIKKNEYNDDSNEIFLNIKNEKRVEFITFHQSFGYEDFIEGFRPNEEGKIYLKDGIFKNISNSASSKVNLNEEKIINRMFKSEHRIFRIEKITNEDIFLKDEENNSDNLIQISKKMILELLENINNGNITLEEIKNRKIENLRLYFDKFYGGNNLIIYNLCKSFIEEINYINGKNFFLVIDEINRGNISKIFGELITLIEESKRDNYEVTLPYSKEKFKVPSNLYIIGTMNTTDKSIALIDVALRRRFTFLKMLPNTDLVIKGFSNEFVKLNEQIKKDLGEEYQIGHSYFMNIPESDLDFVKEYKIKPLLEEYYYGDEEKLKIALKIIGFEDNYN
ncbi:McrB family protein [Arcobacter arenosus]|uniref:AAA+ ATPase domain-containing protein n=1 Tax=Arcobacter arenosus TaxID=2576037 RepID=A0A5R8XXS5_9BACT|nr:AAA family ATPase [Arcobacter arenosus]TLP36224.1 hypothetical protein FDK22_13215 [Arcobacter arenosus]